MEVQGVNIYDKTTHYFPVYCMTSVEGHYSKDAFIFHTSSILWPFGCHKLLFGRVCRGSNYWVQGCIQYLHALIVEMIKTQVGRAVLHLMQQSYGGRCDNP